MLGVGDCPTGIDRLVRERWPEALLFAADWQRLGKRAGPERNGRMVTWAAEAHMSALAAFPGPRSKGTWSCIRLAREASVGVLIKRVGQ